MVIWKSMEIRKVQLTGGSSFVVTLPKVWVEQIGIRKNDPLGLFIQPDGTLLVTRNTEDRITPLTRKFDVSRITDRSYFFRMLIGAYIAGYTTFEVTAKVKIDLPIRGVVREFCQMTIGPEVIEETENRVLVKDLLNPTEMPFENTIRRMFVIVQSMHADAFHAFETKNRSLAAEVIARDNDVNRLHWLVGRQRNMVLKNTSLSRKMGVSTTMVMDIYIISRIIERIGDHAVKIMEHFANIFNKEVPAPVLTKLREAEKMARGIIEQSITAYFNQDLKSCHKNIEQVRFLIALCNDINSQSMGQETDLAIAIADITESIRRSGEYAGDISETVINHLMEDQDLAI